MIMIRRALMASVALMLALPQMWACTSAIVAPKASATGKALLWKHRDTGTEHNFVAPTAATDSTMAFVALYNGGDSLLTEAWAGMNESGFAVMNTASYNLAPDTTDYKDREGVVMALALGRCRTVDDFARLLDTLPKPLGVQANFGVIDASGNGAYFETDDYNYTRFPLSDADNGIILRTNYSVTGNDTDGYGYIRYNNACRLAGDAVKSHSVRPSTFTEGLSRSFYHSLFDRDFLAGSDRWAVDQDFIPRNSSSASLVVEQTDEGPVMWVMIGYPPCSHVERVTVTDVPADLLPTEPGWRSAECNRVVERKHKAFPIERGSGPHYVDLDYLRTVIPAQRELSRKAYAR